jgi:hypothetical protein
MLDSYMPQTVKANWPVIATLNVADLFHRIIITF